MRIPLGFGKHAIKSMGRPLSVKAHLKRNITEFKSKDNFFAHAIIIAKANVDEDPK